ncbi:MAG: hypothetical protein IJX52_04405, partial [Oscillibacter sp.]|nr:hypothetical protein [Oscillibacter sp.]
MKKWMIFGVCLLLAGCGRQAETVVKEKAPDVTAEQRTLENVWYPSVDTLESLDGVSTTDARP